VHCGKSVRWTPRWPPRRPEAESRVFGRGSAWFPRRAAPPNAHTCGRGKDCIICIIMSYRLKESRNTRICQTEDACVCICIYVCVCMRVYMYVCICIYIYVCMYVCVGGCRYMCVYICLCLTFFYLFYVYITKQIKNVTDKKKLKTPNRDIFVRTVNSQSESRLWSKM